MLNIINNVSPTELGIIVVILIVLFGSTLTKKLARISGETVKEIKNLKKEFYKAIDNDEPSTKK